MWKEGDEDTISNRRKAGHHEKSESRGSETSVAAVFEGN